MGKLTLYQLNVGSLSNTGVSQVLVENYSSRCREVRLVSDIPARLFLIEQPRMVPEWLTYLKPLLDEKVDMQPAQTQGALLLIQAGPGDKLFAASWGTGRYLLRSHAIEPKLGLKTALNLISSHPETQAWEPSRFRAIAARRVDANTLSAQYQFARQAALEQFPFIFDTDQLKSVTGRPLDIERWGNTISGGVSIVFRWPAEPRQIVDFCRKIEEVMAESDYQRHFEFIDNVQAETHSDVLTRLQMTFLKKLHNNELDRMFTSPPELIEWEEVDHFAYCSKAETETVEEPEVESMRKFLNDLRAWDDLDTRIANDELNIAALNSNGDQIKSWPFMDWFGGEIDDPQNGNQIHYVLDQGAFYKVSPEYLDKLDVFVRGSEITGEGKKSYALTNEEVTAAKKKLAARKKNSASPTSAEAEEDDIEVDTTSYSEDAYVLAMVDKNAPKSIELHKYLVREKTKNTTPIEICDVALSDPRQLMHLKVSTHSTSLSHLFSQASVSAELLRMDEQFKETVREVLNKSDDPATAGFNWLYDKDFDTRQCTVVMGIICKKEKNLADCMPFFSRVNYRMRCLDLRKMGYAYKLVKVPEYGK